VWTYEESYAEIFGARDPKVAFLGTGPMALSFAAQILSTAAVKNVKAPKVSPSLLRPHPTPHIPRVLSVVDLWFVEILWFGLINHFRCCPPYQVVLLTEQANYYDALKATGFRVVDERDGSEFLVAPEQLVVVKSVAEYEALHPSEPPQLVFGTMQMGKKTERWGLVQPVGSEKVTVLSAANGIPYTTMVAELHPFKGKLNTGHATAYVKARAEIITPTSSSGGDDNNGGKPHITVTCTDAGKISIGSVGADAADTNSWFGSVTALLEGPIYKMELSKNAKQEAMNKVVRNLTNPICLAATVAQYRFVSNTSEITAYRYGVHMEKRCFANALNKATFEAGRALGLSPAEIAHHIGKLDPRCSLLPSRLGLLVFMSFLLVFKVNHFSW
jgi:ketopantoate reductase